MKQMSFGKITMVAEERPLPHLLGVGQGSAGSSPMPSDRGSPHSTTLRAPRDQPNKSGDQTGALPTSEHPT